MSTTHRLIFGLTILCKFVCSQKSIDDACTLQSTGLPGICKLYGDCQQAREGVQKNVSAPQTCGLQGTQPIVCCPQQRKPECREYANYVVEDKEWSVSSMYSPEIPIHECGHKAAILIPGREPEGPNAFPHMAALGYELTPGDIQWLCGGTILSEEYVLTASHCLSDYSVGSAKWVTFGITNLMNTKNRQIIKIVERIPYPEYKISSHYHDIGLIKLEKPATLNSYARPACLYLKPEVSAKKAVATGWGQTSWAGQGSNELLKVTLELYDNDYCNSSYKHQISRKLRNGVVNDIQLCAGSKNEEKDTCQGDSGGPLQIYHIGDDIKCMYDIIGVTSFGQGCSGEPSVYVRVSHYVKWIEDIVWP